MKEAYIGLGSNLGNRLGNLAKALALLARNSRIKLEKISPLYWTAPVGPGTQPEFLNGVVKIKTSLKPMQLLACLHRVEAKIGRIRRGKNLPRPVDLDILEHGRQRLRRPGLVIPHPRMLERRFVLEPLADLDPRRKLVTSRDTVKKLLSLPEISSQRVVRAAGPALRV